MSKLVFVVNHKGGVGKTTLASNLAAIGVEMGRSLIAIDTDPQGSLANWHLRSTRAKKEVPEVRLLPARRLVERLADPRDDLRVNDGTVIIDTAPAASKDITALLGKLRSDDFVIIPVTPGGYELDALQSTLAIAPKNRAMLILNRASDLAVSREARRFLENKFPDLPLHIVRDYAAFGSAATYGGSVLSNYPNGPAADDIRRLGRALWS